MTNLKALPSMLVFGPQTELPSDETLEELRHELTSNNYLASLRQAVTDISSLWETLVNSDSDLSKVPGAAYLEELGHWVTHGGSFPHRHRLHVPNLYHFPVTLILQICQYTRYLRLQGEDSHSNVLGKAQAGGVQGFCIGFLAAAAVASAKDEAGLGFTAAIGFRLAVCIAGYIDLDSTFSNDIVNASCVAVRWREDSNEDKAKLDGIMQNYKQAYISSFNDKSCVTVTLRGTDLDSFVAEARQKNLLPKLVPVHGRFHYNGQDCAAEKLMELVMHTKELQFPPVDQLNAPVRSTVDGSIIAAGSLTRIALENTLLKPADWYGTMMSSLSKIQSPEKSAVVMAGFGNHLPSSIVQKQTFDLINLSKLSQESDRGESPTLAVSNTLQDSSQYPSHAIAIVGMAGKFPGADSVDELWDIVLSSKNMAEPAPVDRLQLSQTGEYAKTKWWGNFLRDPHAFDSRFFKKSSREALAWDPQQRILLEVIYEALESGGYFGASSKQEPLDYGCYIGSCMNNYYDNMSCHAATAYATIGTSRCFLSGCMSHHFGWTGPSLTIDTACSSSLVAINTACRAIWSGECSRAIAGGSNVISSPFDYQNLSAAGFLSPSGQCKPFDANADGYCRGEGVGVVVLKRLSEAIADNDTIHGIILGSAANQNHNDSHVTVPHSGSQVDLYQRVMRLGEINPESVSYVEAHGTGTGVGDPVEVRSIRDAFGGPQRDSILHFGSLKGNIGHTEATAGVAGLIKVLLMMRHGQIPAQASHTALNPKIPDFSQHQMAIPKTIVPWNSPLRTACVNSYGAAGSNSALLVCEKPVSKVSTVLAPASKYPLVICAGSENSLVMYSKKLLGWLDEAVEANNPNLLASLTFNLANRANHALPHVLAKTVSSISDVRSILEASASRSASTAMGISQNPGPAVLVFGGQESDHIGLSKDIYLGVKVFRHHLDTCNDILESKGLESLYPAIFQAEPIKDLVTLHSALFAVQYASANAWMDCGLKPDAVVGHSFGQLTALCISGTLSLPDALTLVVGRAALMVKQWGAEPGTMLFVQADRQTVADILKSTQLQADNHYVEIACYNGPKSHVVVGSSNSINALEQYITKTPTLRDSIRTKRLRVTHGFHSKYTETLLPDLAALAEQLVWNRPSIPIETCDEFASVSEPDYSIVANHTRQPVFFQSAIERLAERFPGCSWIEAGRGSSVLQLVKGCISDSQGHDFISPLPAASPNVMSSLADATIQLWRSGFQVQYWPFHRIQKPEYDYCSLPAYQFERQQHWLPFTGRGLEKEMEQPKPVQETHELLSFVQFKDASEKEAVFRIDPQAERFNAMLGGHVMAGYALAPASLYFELAARAALLLQNDTEAETFVPTVENLVMNSPIGKDTTSEIRLTLKRLDSKSSTPTWSFSLTTQATVGAIAAPYQQSTGKVCLKPRDFAQTVQDFKRFESLTGYRRYDQLVNHPDAERMQGNHIYRAFNTVVHYGEAFRGIKQVACVGMEAAGKVVITPPSDDPTDQRLCHTPMTDSFMQFAGFLVNYFNNPSLDDVFVCQHIEHIEIGGDFDPDAKEWIVYSNMTEGGEADVSSDAYVFEATSKKMVMAAFGFRFSKMSKALLGRLLKNVNKSEASNSRSVVEEPARVDMTVSAMTTHNDGDSNRASSHRPQLLQVISNVTDVPVDEITDESTLDDLGVDSLMATEVINDIRSILGLTIDLTSFLFFPNIGAVAAHVDEKLGVCSSDADDSETCAPSTPSENSYDSGIADVIDLDLTKKLIAIEPEEVAPISTQVVDPLEPIKRPTITSASDAFHEIKRSRYDKLAEGTKALGFWTDAYPHQARLVLAYVVEAFDKLGCDVKKLRVGDQVPQVVGTLPRHKQLVDQFYRILEDGKLICSMANKDFTRTEVLVDPTPAESIFHEIINLYPQHAGVNRLVRAVGSELAACLKGEIDGLQIVFGNRENKKLLEDMYEYWPLLRTPTLLLGDFLTKALSNATGGGKFRILEIGAGTGGTTRYIVNHLRSHGIPFEYVYSDISSSLVAAARKQFKGVEGMSFELLDITKPPKPEYLQAFHCIIATNCIHATPNLGESLSNLRKLLREDGALTLVEITQNMFWLDIVVGLFEGWWLFEDGRTHALVSEKHWERQMKKAGFNEVLWTGGASPESGTVRVIGAFPLASSRTSQKTVKAAVETVVYKKVGDLEIHADVYCPVEDADLPSKKMPIALMIHGGSHIIFSRKDIRPAQTRLLLEKGFLPVSLDHRLCPEVSLAQGPMVDVCDALSWARNTLPNIPLKRRDLQIDGERVVVVGWSSGGQLAMSLAWTAPQRGLRPPEAVLAFYCPTNYEDEWWRHPIQPIGAEDKGQQYDVLEAIGDEPISNYGVVGAWEPLSDPRIMTDPRCRIVLHINWKAQTLPVIIGGLLSKAKAASSDKDKDWNALPQPSLDLVRAASPRAQIVQGNYNTPTFLIHGTADDLIPWQQSQETYQAMSDRGVAADLVLVEGAPHICDLSSDPESEGWKAALKGYDFISSFVF